MKPQITVIVAGKSLSRFRKKYSFIKKPLHLSLHSNYANVAFSFYELETFVEQEIDSLLKDLLDIAVVVYMSDKWVDRPLEWVRPIHILMPVRNLKIWNGYKKQLSSMLSLMTGDDFGFHFYQGKKEKTAFNPFENSEEKQCVSLLSGGLDSLAGAKWLLDNEYIPSFSSHYSKNLRPIQRELVSRLDALYPKVNLYGSRFHQTYITRAAGNVFKKLPSPVQNTQYSRSFLFLSLGLAQALSLGIDKVFMFENGQIAINVKLSEARVNTRTAHPKFVEAYNKLVNSIFEMKIKVSNPFISKTKSEIVKILDQDGFRKLIEKTVSCWRHENIHLFAYHRGKRGFQGKHCGTCPPCVIRRIAVHNAGLWNFDDKYVIDIFKDYPDIKRNEKSMIADLLRFSNEIDRKNQDDIMLDHTEFQIDVDGINPYDLIKMYKRFAKETKNCFQSRGNSALVTEFARLLG